MKKKVTELLLSLKNSNLGKNYFLFTGIVGKSMFYLFDAVTFFFYFFLKKILNLFKMEYGYDSNIWK